MKSGRNLRRLSRIGGWITLLGFALALLGALFSRPLEPHPLLLAGAVVFLGGTVFRAAVSRCPQCGCHLAFFCKTLPDRCPKCGAELDQDGR